MDAEVDVVLVERLDRGGVWSRLDDLVNPLAGAHHLVPDDDDDDDDDC